MGVGDVPVTQRPQGCARTRPRKSSALRNCRFHGAVANKVEEGDADRDCDPHGDDPPMKDV